MDVRPSIVGNAVSARYAAMSVCIVHVVYAGIRVVSRVVLVPTVIGMGIFYANISALISKMERKLM